MGGAMTQKSWSDPILEVAGGASRVAFVAFAAAAGAIGLVALGGSLDDEMRGPALVIAGPIALVAGAIAYWIRRRAHARRISVHAEGVCERRGDRTISLRSDQIASIEVRTWNLQAGVAGGVGGAAGALANAAVRTAASGGATDLPYDATQVRVTFVGDDGRRVTLCKWDARWLEAYTAIRARVEPRLLGLARAELGRSGAVAFGAVRVSRDDIAVGARAVPFGELERIDVSGTGVVALRKKGKRLPAATARLPRVPNLHVMLDLVGERQAAIATRPAA